MKNPLPVHELVRGNGSAFANAFVVGIGIGICISPTETCQETKKRIRKMKNSVGKIETDHLKTWEEN